MELYNNSIIAATRDRLGAAPRRWDYDPALAWRDTGTSELVMLRDAAFELARTAKKVDGITRTLTHILKGILTNCGSCNLKPICDEAEGMREMRFGMKNKQK